MCTNCMSIKLVWTTCRLEEVVVKFSTRAHVDCKVAHFLSLIGRERLRSLGCWTCKCFMTIPLKKQLFMAAQWYARIIDLEHACSSGPRDKGLSTENRLQFVKITATKSVRWFNVLCMCHLRKRHHRGKKEQHAIHNGTQLGKFLSQPQRNNRVKSLQPRFWSECYHIIFIQPFFFLYSTMAFLQFQFSRTSLTV